MMNETEETEKINFWSAANTYRGSQIIFYFMLIFILSIAAVLTIFILDPNQLGGEVRGDYFVVPVVTLIFLVIIGSGLKTIQKNWPMCPNHNERLVIINKENLGENIIITFECPQKDHTIRRLAPKPKKKTRR